MTKATGNGQSLVEGSSYKVGNDRSHSVSATVAVVLSVLHSLVKPCDAAASQ